MDVEPSVTTDGLVHANATGAQVVAAVLAVQVRAARGTHRGGSWWERNRKSF
jgi:hypothetical protein